MFSFHTKLSVTSLYLPCCDPGAGSSSCTGTLRAGYCCLKSISTPLPLIYTCLFLQSLYSLFFFFYALCFIASSCYTFSRQTCSLSFYRFNVMLLFLTTPVSLGEFCLQVTSWSWFSGEVLRLMLDCSVKLAIISTAWIQTQEEKTSHWHVEDFKHPYGFREVLLFPAACSLNRRCWALNVLKSSRWTFWQSPLVDSLTTRCGKLNAFVFHYFDSTFLFLMRVLTHTHTLSQLDSAFDVRKFVEQQ